MSYDRDDRKKRKSGPRPSKADARRARVQKHARHWEPTDFQIAARAAFADVDVLVLSGPPGSSKTFTGTWLALEELLAERVKKIHLLRPAVEAGEKIGYLPGSANEKLAPFLIPVLEFLRALGLDGAGMIRDGTLEPVPIGYAQGRTFSSSVVLVDEAQNLSRKQMRLVLTRLGANSKLILTGDAGQAEVPETPNAFQTLVAKMAVAGEDWYRLFQLTELDILRHANVPDLLRMVGGPEK